MLPPILNEALRDRLHCLIDSYQRLTGHPLLDPAPDCLLALWNAPRVVVAHGCEPDPVFFYGNRMALQLFEMDFLAFTSLPSRFSAEAPNRQERARLLERVSQKGFIDDYAGIRIASSGRRFRIEQATVWNLMDQEGQRLGQAATFSHWQMV